MSLRLRLYTLGARLLVRPLLARMSDPVKGAAKLDLLVRLGGWPPRSTSRRDDTLGGRPGHWITATGADRRRVILYFHGGAYLAGSGRTHGAMLARLSLYARLPIAAQDYRLLQEAPFPAAPQDALAAWDDLRARGFAPGQIVLGGDSAGGGLMLGLLAQLLARGERPAAAFAMSPWTDLTLSGDTIRTNAAQDATLPAARIAEAAQAYLGGADPKDPRASPLFADFPDCPPVLIQVGSPEILESDAFRMADRLRSFGAAVTLQQTMGAPHVWHLGHLWVPEARAALREIARFVQASLDATIR